MASTEEFTQSSPFSNPLWLLIELSTSTVDQKEPLFEVVFHSPVRRKFVHVSELTSTLAVI